MQVLSPIGVVPARQNQGVGTALIRRGLELLSDAMYRSSSWKGHRGITRASGSSQAQPLDSGRLSLRIPDAGFRVLRLPTYGLG